MQEIEEGLHNLQYAAWILENMMAAPATKAWLELIGDSLTALQKSKNLTGAQACKYMVRAITLAKGQNINVDWYFYRDAEYAKVRPLPVTPTGQCSIDCRAKHGRGYHENDVKWVWRYYMAEVKAGGSKTPDDFFREIDTKRQAGLPEWKR